jgi:hypothetical protein
LSGVAEPTERVLVGSRRKAAGYLAAALALLALDVLLIRSGHSARVHVRGWLILPLLALGVFALAISVVRPGRVRLTPQNLSVISSLGTTRVIAWRDIESFSLWGRRRGTMVTYRFLLERRPTDLMTRINSRTGVDGSLPSSLLEITPDQLLSLVNAYWSRAKLQP